MKVFNRLYHKFISLEIAAEASLDFPKLDAIEKKVLGLLSSYWVNEKTITVVEAINMTSEISTSTLFRYLKKLRQKGYVELIVDEKDNRVKYVSPTKQADQYFSQLGQLMLEAVG